MAVFLKVLSIIGIVLLSVLGLIVLILLLVLFVPVRYGAKGEFKDNKPYLSAKATWLLHLVSVKYTLGKEDPLTIKIFGFKLKQKEDKMPDFEDDDKTEEFSYEYQPAVIETNEINETHEIIHESIPESIPVSESASEEIPEDNKNQEKVEQCKEENPDSEFIKSDSTVKTKKGKKEKHKKNDFENQSFYDRIKKYIEIIKTKRFKKAFEFSKQKIFKLLKHIKPRRLSIKGEVGFEDPSLTGTILAVTSMLIPIFGNSVKITGNFEEPIISIEGSTKGHITILRVLWTLAVLYFNRNLRKIIKMFREV